MQLCAAQYTIALADEKDRRGSIGVGLDSRGLCAKLKLAISLSLQSSRASFSPKPGGLARVHAAQPQLALGLTLLRKIIFKMCEYTITWYLISY